MKESIKAVIEVEPSPDQLALQQMVEARLAYFEAMTDSVTGDDMSDSKRAGMRWQRMTAKATHKTFRERFANAETLDLYVQYVQAVDTYITSLKDKICVNQECSPEAMQDFRLKTITTIMHKEYQAEQALWDTLLQTRIESSVQEHGAITATVRVLQNTQNAIKSTAAKVENRRFFTGGKLGDLEVFTRERIARLVNAKDIKATVVGFLMGNFTSTVFKLATKPAVKKWEAKLHDKFNILLDMLRPNMTHLIYDHLDNGNNAEIPAAELMLRWYALAEKQQNHITEASVKAIFKWMLKVFLSEPASGVGDMFDVGTYEAMTPDSVAESIANKVGTQAVVDTSKTTKKAPQQPAAVLSGN